MKANRIIGLIFVLLCALPAFSQTSPVPVAAWDVTFNLSGNVSRRLTFISMSNGTGTFRLIGPRTTQVPSTFPAVWARPVTGLMSFSAEVELPIGNCCRETGTLMFKGTQNTTSGTITGRAIFAADLTPVTAPTNTGIYFGTFVATPLPVVALRNRKGTR